MSYVFCLFMASPAAHLARESAGAEQASWLGALELFGPRALHLVPFGPSGAPERPLSAINEQTSKGGSRSARLILRYTRRACLKVARIGAQT